MESFSKQINLTKQISKTASTYRKKIIELIQFPNCSSTRELIRFSSKRHINTRGKLQMSLLGEIIYDVCKYIKI